jgi:hypothetical protein
MESKGEILRRPHIPNWDTRSAIASAEQPKRHVLSKITSGIDEVLFCSYLAAIPLAPR